MACLCLEFLVFGKGLVRVYLDGIQVTGFNEMVYN